VAIWREVEKRDRSPFQYPGHWIRLATCWRGPGASRRHVPPPPRS
jgi:hypothetical protein